MISALNKYNSQTLPNHFYCSRPKCLHKQYHKTESHTCKLCGQFHSELNCSRNPEFIERRNAELSDCNNPEYKLKCPNCRRDCAFSESKHKIYGIDTKCILCLENNIDAFLPCGHVIMCIKCLKHIAITDSNTSDIMDWFPSYAPYDKIDQYFRRKFKGVDGPIYSTVYAGTGCYWIIRRNGIGELSETYLLHSDNEYCLEIQEEAQKFMNNYRYV